MDPLEILERDTLRQHAEQAPDVSVLAPGRTRRFGGPAVAASAAAVAAVVAAVVAVVLAVQPGRGGTGKPGLPPAVGTGVDTAAPPAGYVWASYHGIEVAVPKITQWLYVTCYPPTTSYVEFTVPGVAVSCPGRPLNRSVPDPNSVSVTLAPVGVPPDPQLPGDHRPRHTRTLADPGVVVQVAAATEAQVDLILGSIRRVSVDHLGCADRLASTTPRNPPGSSLAPSGPRAAVVCSYATMGADGRYWLVASHRLDGTEATELAARFDALSGPGMRSTDTYLPPVDWVVFDYGTATRTVAIERWAYPASVTDGRRTVAADSAAADPPLPAI